jgi:hypothetical protein
MAVFFANLLRVSQTAVVFTAGDLSHHYHVWYEANDFITSLGVFPEERWRDGRSG